MLNITIKSGSKYRLSYKGSSDLVTTDSVKQGVLTIKQSGNMILNLHKTTNSEITLTIPTGSTLDSINISSDVGDISMDMDGLTASTISVSSDVGDITLRECNFSEIDASSDVGDIEIYSGIDLSNAKLSLKTDLGAVSVNGTSHHTEFNQESSQKDLNPSLSAKSSLGDISVVY